MAWRYCRVCDHPQDRITIEQIAECASSEIRCEKCFHDREDDTFMERTAIIAEALIELRRNKS